MRKSPVCGRDAICVHGREALEPGFPETSANISQWPCDTGIRPFREAPTASRSDHGRLKTARSLRFAGYHDPANIQWGALRIFNDDRVAGGQGFPTHPQASMEILTYLLEGALDERGQSKTATGAAGDAIRPAGWTTLDVSGTAELVLWDIPPLR